MGATVMKAIPGNQGESTDQKPGAMNLAAKKYAELKMDPPSSTDPQAINEEGKKKKKKDKGTILTSVAGVTDDAEISNPTLMGGY
jgi:hypothetical protein